MSSDIATSAPYPPLHPGQQDLADFGVRLAQAGLGPNARGLVAMVQEAAVAVALQVAPDILERLAIVTATRFTQLASRVQGMQGMGPWVRRDQVLMLIQQAAMTNPTTH